MTAISPGSINDEVQQHLRRHSIGFAFSENEATRLLRESCDCGERHRQEVGPALHHDLLVHLQYQHALDPPYQGTPYPFTTVEFHARLHKGAEDALDREHPVDLMTLPPRHQYGTRGPRAYYSDVLAQRTGR